jgi:hypothetical protein
MHFTPRELARVGVAATMMVFGGTVIIILMTMMLGHYNSLAHSGPKAVLDGAVIALLLGRTARWRCVALLGVVYGLVLLIQVGVAYLPLVLAVAGVVGMCSGAAAGGIRRAAGVLAAAAAFEWAAGLGSPLKIVLGTADAREPFLWGLWMAEWPLRIGGAMIGVVLAWRWAARWEPTEPSPAPTRLTATRPGGRADGVRGVGPAGVRLAVLLTAAIVPMAIQAWTALAAMAGLALLYALVLGRPRLVMHALLGVAWGTAVFMAASFLWHRDTERALDLLRTFGLRFAPMAMASAVMLGSVRAVDLVRVLRCVRVPGAVLLPLAYVLRQIPLVRREIVHGFALLRSQGHWTGPWSLLRNPRPVLSALLWRPLQRWADQLVE